MPLNENVRRKLQGMGIDPDQMLQRMQNYVGPGGQAFATPQEYAGAIQSKEAAGESLQDPVTAAQFRQMDPGMFGEEPRPNHAEFPYNVGQIPEGLKQQAPKAYAMMDAIAQYQQKTPFTIPYAPGTQTIAEREADRSADQWERSFEEGVRQYDTSFEEGVRQWDMGFEEDVRQFGLSHAMAKRQQDHREWADRQRINIQKAAAKGAPVTGPESPFGVIDTAIGQGYSVDELIRFISEPANAQTYAKYDLSVDDMVDYGLGKYKGVWSGLEEAAGGLIHYEDFLLPETPAHIKTLEESQQNVKAAEEALQKRSGFRTEAELQELSRMMGWPIEDIRQMEAMGTLDDVIQNWFGGKYRYQDPGAGGKMTLEEFYKAGVEAGLGGDELTEMWKERNRR